MATMVLNTINFNKVLKFYDYVALNETYSSLIKLSIGVFLKAHFEKFNLPKIINTKFLFVKTVDRADYNFFFDTCYHACPEPKCKLSIIKVSAINFKYIFNFLINIYLMKQIEARTAIEKWYKYILLIKFVELIPIFDKYEFKVLTVFADMQPIDNLLVQNASIKKVPTVTMQHGLYVDYNSQPNNLNNINFTNLVSDYFLAWGDETATLIKKYNSNVHIIKTGKPIESTTLILKKNQYISVLFDQNLFEEYNKKLLKIGIELSQSLNCGLNLKMHPLNQQSNYELSYNRLTFDQPIEQSLFVIGHTTTMIYEVMRKGCPVYKLKSDIPSNKIDSNLEFDSIEDLLDKIKQELDFMSLGKYYIEYIGQESLNKYNLFYKGLDI